MSIQITINKNREKTNLTTHFGAYRNLMFLLRDNLIIPDFGECGGAGKCGTCIIKIIGLKGKALDIERNEPITLEKMGYWDISNIRLSCQIFITQDIDGAEIEIE